MLLTAAVAAFAAGVAVGAGGEGDEQVAEREQEERQERALKAVDRLSLRQQVGQVIVSSFPDRSPPDYIRRRLRANETAGVILFGFNADGRAGWRALTRAIQRPARRRALVMVDQEGGDVRSVDLAGPAAGQPYQGEPAAVRRTARAAARRLRGVGVNVNLAPVADVPGGPRPVLGFRAFAGDARGIAA
ncbi:MAG: glycoside hydrolase family 3 N-terminal domain-containing protein, partial [Thermoleophilaceae bacterium]